MNGMLDGIRKYVDNLNARNIQGLPVFQLTTEQYDLLADDLQKAGAKHGFEGRPALMVYGAKVELK